MSRPDEWVFYTHITIKCSRNDPLFEASGLLMKEFIFDIDEIKKEIENNGRFRIIINTDGHLDLIELGGQKKSVFLKSRFLSNKKFKQKLIEYYNPHKLFVKGPINIVNKNGTNSPLWYVDLCKFI